VRHAGRIDPCGFGQFLFSDAGVDELAAIELVYIGECRRCGVHESGNGDLVGERRWPLVGTNAIFDLPCAVKRESNSLREDGKRDSEQYEGGSHSGGILSRRHGAYKGSRYPEGKHEQ
jgi:hypothetical protein